MTPSDLHTLVCDAFNRRDVDALVALYEPDAVLFGPEGPVRGLDAIRVVWAGFVEMGGTLVMETRFAVEHGDIALLSNRWTMTIGEVEITATTSEVARRQPDGSWRYVIDNPDGAGVLEG